MCENSADINENLQMNFISEKKLLRKKEEEEDMYKEKNTMNVVKVVLIEVDR